MKFTLPLICCLALQVSAQAAQVYLSQRNTEVPFCYLHGNTRSWPFLEEKLPAGSTVSFVVRQENKVLAEGTQLNFSGFQIRLNSQQKLEIVSQADLPPSAFTLEVSLHLPDGQVESQKLSIRPAPPQRPISYLADFGDDLIRIFWDSRAGQWRPITKCSFDQYFRRCQAHGVQRLILWQTPFPFICDPTNYAAEDWGRYEKQIRALLDSELFNSLTATLTEQSLKNNHSAALISWGWNRKICELRLQRNLGAMISRSATEHGIKLTASFRPFETALTKYYEIPTFDHQGKYLWGFLPFASPVVNYHPDKTCFAHFRTVLKQMGHADAGQLSTIEIQGVENADAFLQRFQRSHDNLRIVASNFPPLHEDSLVLQRQPAGEFLLRPFGQLRQQAEQHQTVLHDFQVEKHGNRVRITNLQVPPDLRYLILSNPADAEQTLDLPTDVPVQMVAQAGNRLGRGNIYWALGKTLDPTGLTKVAGIPKSGRFHSEFSVTEKFQELTLAANARLPLKQHQVVIDLGAPWSVEMLDLNRPALRANVVKELATLLKYPAFDELFINTRSHVSLAHSMADGAAGVQPIVKYRRSGKKIRSWLGIDRAFAPISAANDPVLQAWAADTKSVEQITTWQTNEWSGQCQSENSPFRWRYVRNREVAKGVRQLLKDLEQDFPDVRTRIVIPPSEQTVLATKDELEPMLDSAGKPYGRDYSRIWSTINHIPAIGEGMAMVNLSGLSTEPVVFGVRGLPDPEPLDLYLRHCFADLADNRGSTFRGPRSFFFEAQESLRNKDQDAARRRRGQIVCECLAHTNDLNEVIFYEAADWLYYLPLSQPEICGHAYLEDCSPRQAAETDPSNPPQNQ